MSSDIEGSVRRAGVSGRSPVAMAQHDAALFEPRRNLHASSGRESPLLAVVRYRTMGDRLDVDRAPGATVSPGMRAELEEMREVEERLATWAAGRVASLERPHSSRKAQ